MNLYFISGLGADKRVFKKLILPQQYNIHHIDWIEVTAGESLAAYSIRLSAQIDTTKPFSLIGLSFGGMLAIEMAKFLRPVQTILISSITGPAEVSGFYIFLGKLKLFKLLPLKRFLKPSPFLFRLFGAHSEEERALLSTILKDTNPFFFRWAMNAIFSWNNTFKPDRFLHIHGTADKILPYNDNMQAFKIPGGEHLMVYSKAGIVSDLLKDHLI